VKQDLKWLRRTAALLTLGLIPSLAAAQSGQAQKDSKAPAKAAVAQDTGAKKLADIDQRLAEARKGFEEKLKAAASDEERQKIVEAGTPEKSFVGEYQALAKAAKGTEVAAKALNQILMLGAQSEDMESAKAAARTLLVEHLASPEMGLMVFAAEQVLVAEDGQKALEELKAKNTTKPVVAAFLFVELQKTAQAKGEDAPELKPLYTRLAKEFADVKMPFGEDTYGKFASGWIFVHENLVVGKVAPGFEAVDENGAKWKLEEYRGKVVVIDFWGDW
jgi:hypothetical protein